MVTIWGNGSKNSKIGFATEPAHRPSLVSEKIRIYNNRGEVRETHEGIHRIYLRARMHPGLKVSRSLGDLIPHQIGVISEPEFKVIPISSMDKFLIIATDSVWEYVQPEYLIDYVNDMN